MYNKSANKKIKTNCLQCNKEIERIPREGDSGNYFCSTSCSAEYNNPKTKRKHPTNFICLKCNKIFKNSNHFQFKEFCSRNCLNLFNYDKKINEWKNGEFDGMCGEGGLNKNIRKYIFIKYNSQCSECGWSKINQFTKKIPLQVDHIDGNYKNNKEENLRLLCPNCHTLTENYGSRNKGKGRRDWRWKKRMEQKNRTGHDPAASILEV